jgi:hypothetical protein
VQVARKFQNNPDTAALALSVFRMPARTTLQRVDLEDSEVAAPGDDELLAVNDALDKLTAKGLTTLANPKQAWSSLALLPLDVATGT